MALLESPAAEVNTRMEHITASKGSLFQVLWCTGQVHYEKPGAVLPGRFPNSVYACFDSQVPDITRMCEGVGEHLP